MLLLSNISTMILTFFVCIKVFCFDIENWLNNNSKKNLNISLKKLFYQDK